VEGKPISDSPISDSPISDKPIFDNLIEDKPILEKPDTLEPMVHKTCHLCGAIIPEKARFCSNCGAPLQITEATILPWMPAEQEQIQTPRCSLVFVSKSNEPASNDKLWFFGKEIQLNRNNTEPGNQTITSKIQAELIFENGKWYIQDKSALKSTYIYAGEKKELKSGDVIVMGNRSFEFNDASESRTDEPLKP
jgi:hypothetical protein